MKYYVYFTVDNKDQFEGRICHNDIWDLYGDEPLEAKSQEEAIDLCIQHLIDNADQDETVWWNTDETSRIELNSYTNYAIVINNNSVVFVDKRDEERKIIIKSGNSDWSIYYENDNDEYNDDDISVLCYSFIARQAEADDGE